MKSSGVTCLSSCVRQENKITTSAYKFPNMMFLNSPELFRLIQKLSWSCQKNLTRFGPKRRFLDIQHPRLCPLFDEHIYTNLTLTAYLLTVEPLALPATKLDLQDILQTTPAQTAEFKQELLQYATNNLVKITAFVDSPYVTKFETVEVGSF